MLLFLLDHLQTIFQQCSICRIIFTPIRPLADKEYTDKYFDSVHENELTADAGDFVEIKKM